jgi:hypothetical protein
MACGRLATGYRLRVRTALVVFRHVCREEPLKP